MGVCEVYPCFINTILGGQCVIEAVGISERVCDAECAWDGKITPLCITVSLTDGIFRAAPLTGTGQA
jgi:hypothetical protein